MLYLLAAVAAVTTLGCAVLVAVVASQRVRLAAAPAPGEIAELRARLAVAPDPVLLTNLQTQLAAARAVVESAGARVDELQREVLELKDEVSSAWAAANDAQVTHAGLAAALEAEREKASALVAAESRMADTFAALSSESLERSRTAFLQLAEQQLSRARSEGVADLDARTTAVAGMVAPVAEALTQVQDRMQRLEVTRAEADASVVEQVRALQTAQQELRAETANLVTALRAPSVRGRWGELQLRRVVEAAGMVRHCDFDEQVRAVGPDGGLRPDLVVRLPGDKCVVVDAKVPLQAYLEAIEAADEQTRTRKLAEHARQLRNHVDQLAGKRYQDAFALTPDVVVLFVPGDSILSAAAEADVNLWEHAAKRRVLLAGPTSLIGLLHVISHGWKQEAVAEHARQIASLGRELYKRLSVLGEHLDKTGRSLDKAVDGFNSAIGSLETRVLVTARKLNDLEIAEGELRAPAMIERTTRPLTAEELTALDAGAA